MGQLYSFDQADQQRTAAVSGRQILPHELLCPVFYGDRIFLLGFLLAAYLNVPVLGIALLGVIIVALMLVNDQNKPNNTAVVDGGADDDF